MKFMKKTAKEIWVNLPVWYIFYVTAYTVFGFTALLEKPRPDYAVTALFPYSLFLLYYYGRSRDDEGNNTPGGLRKFLIVAGMSSAVLILAFALSRPIRLASDWPSHFDRAVLGFEASNITWTLLIALHCYLFQGWRKFLLFFGVALIYGMILESSGVAMGFFSEDHYHLYVPGFSAPAATMFGWSAVFYPCVFLLDGLRRGMPLIGNRSFLWQGLLVALIAIFFDALIDPFATDFGLWTWNRAYNGENSLYWFGVPLVNYVSWFTAVFVFGAVYYYFEMKKKEWDQLKRSAAMLCSLPFILLAAGIIEFSSLGLVEGFNGPSWAILKQYIRDGMPLTRPPRKGKMQESHNGGERDVML